MNIYGYCRCSTDESKQNIDRQIRELKLKGVPKENIYLEYESGTKTDRIELNKVLNLLLKGDILISTEASRITRSIKQLLDILELAKEKRIKLVLGSFEIDFRDNLNQDPMTLAMVQIMGVFGELERNIISQRVKSGIANARSKGKRIGRPKMNIEDLPKNFIKHYPKYLNNEINLKELSQICNLSRPTIYKYIDIIEKRR